MGAGRHQILVPVVDVDLAPAVVVVVLSGGIPGPGAWIEGGFIILRHAQLAVDAVESIGTAVVDCGALDTELGVIDAITTQTDEVTIAVAVVDIVVEVRMQRCGNPEPSPD